jgi:hypothetical protein
MRDIESAVPLDQSDSRPCGRFAEIHKTMID